MALLSIKYVLPQTGSVADSFFFSVNNIILIKKWSFFINFYYEKKLYSFFIQKLKNFHDTIF